MAKKAMFGDIGDFQDWSMFDTRRYGNIYFDGKDHGIEFFIFIHTDAYDNMVFSPAVQEEDRQDYLDDLMSKAIHQRDIGVTTQDHILLLSTCSSSSTNGRDILIGRITDEVFDDSFAQTDKHNSKNGIDRWDNFLKVSYLWPALMILTAVLLTVRIVLYNRHKRKWGI
jgi:sortase B